MNQPENSLHRRLSRLTLSIAVVSVVAVFSSGCVSVVEYSPDEGLVSRLGQEESARKLKAVLGRALNPRISEIDVRPDSVVIGFNRGWHPYQFAPVGFIREQVIFSNVNDVVIHENFVVYVVDTNGVVRQQIHFASLEDAKIFDDLIASFRASVAGGSNNAAE